MKTHTRESLTLIECAIREAFAAHMARMDSDWTWTEPERHMSRAYDYWVKAMHIMAYEA